MGIRETLNENQGITIGAAIGVTLLAIGFAIYSMSSGSGTGTIETPKTWFTTDDGKTFFPDDAVKLPPFDKDGKQAVGCVVFQVNGKDKVVGYLFRYTEAGRKAIEESMRGPLTGDVAILRAEAMEVKKPLTGDKGWVKSTDPRANEIRKPPAGGAVEEIYPMSP